ncbi:MAG: hypothetical protein U0P45_17115 [Acidimicrobiales bacterium]
MDELAGTGRLLRLGLRRDRVLISAWTLGFVAMAGVSSAATIDLYPKEGPRVQAANAINGSKALVALYGKIYDPTSIGAVSMIKMGGFGAVFVALLAASIVVRHTRADEESGRAELVAATPTGRLAPLAAALGVAVVAMAVLGALTAAVLVATGLDAEGSLAFGAAWAGVGIAFAAIAAVAAQVASTGRAATATSAAVLAVTYVLRAAGDTAGAGGPTWLSWLSPIGWGQQFRPFAGNRWWVLGITLAFAVATSAVAFTLAARRDLGAGLFGDRAGRPTASASLSGPLGLAARLHRGAVLGWAIGFAAIGVLMGGLASSVADFINNDSTREYFQKLGGASAITDAYLSSVLVIAAIVASAFGIQIVARLRAEEAGGRAEPVLATATSRARWAGGHLVFALGGPVVLLALAGMAAGVAHAATEHDAGQVPRLVGSALVRAPAAWVVVAAVLALFGLAPRAVGAGWGILAFVVLLGELGPLLELPQPVMDLSPFTHVPLLPGATFAVLPLVLLTLVAAGLGGLGLWGLHRRDVG